MQTTLRDLNLREGTSIYGGESLGDRYDAAPQVGVAGPDGDAVGSSEADWNLSRSPLSPDAKNYSMVVTACTQSGKADGALGLLETMRRDGFNPDTVTFASAIAACGRGRGRANLEAPPASLLLASLFDRMRSSTVPSSAPCYARAREACTDAGLCKRGHSFLGGMVAAKVRVEERALKAVVQACACVARSFRQAPTVQLVSKYTGC